MKLDKHMHSASAWSRSAFAGLALTALLAASVQGAPGAHGPNGEHLDGGPASTSGNVSGLARLPDGSVNVPMLAQRRLGIRTHAARKPRRPLRWSCRGAS